MRVRIESHNMNLIPVIKAEGGTVEIKSNGNVWVNVPNTKQYQEISSIKYLITDCYKKTYDTKLEAWAFFDHPASFLVHDGVLAVFRPYKISEWRGMIALLWELGLYVNIYKNEYPFTIVVRKINRIKLADSRNKDFVPNAIFRTVFNQVRTHFFSFLFTMPHNLRNRVLNQYVS